MIPASHVGSLRHARSMQPPGAGWRPALDRPDAACEASSRGRADKAKPAASAVDSGLRDYLAANYALLHRRLARHLGCPDLASESLHDAWLRLGERSPAQAPQNTEAYVYRVACNVAMDRLRGNRSWQYASDAETVLEQLADRAAGPDAIAQARSDLEAMERAMAALPRRQRAVLAALKIDELTRQEVANRHGLSLRHVDTALRQALEQCARQLENV